MTNEVSDQSDLLSQSFTKALLINLIWINASEVLRYFSVLRAMMKSAFPQIPEIAPMNIQVFLSWGVWDTILLFAVTGFNWLYLDRFGNGVRNAIIAGSLVWLTAFVLLWLGLYNMNLATNSIVAAMLPWAWVEMVVASLVVRWCRQ